MGKGDLYRNVFKVHRALDPCQLYGASCAAFKGVSEKEQFFKFYGFQGGSADFTEVHRGRTL